MVSMRTLKLFCGISLLALPLALAGCSGQHDPDNAPALIAEPNSPIADAPVPVGYSMMNGQSSSHVIPATGLRFVDHSYSGGNSVLQVVRFYRDVLPQHGWTFVTQDQAHKEVSLRFSKNNEDARVEVWPGTLATHVRIKIEPAVRDGAK